jgi:hypothetical protein
MVVETVEEIRSDTLSVKPVRPTVFARIIDAIRALTVAGGRDINVVCRWEIQFGFV